MRSTTFSSRLPAALAALVLTLTACSGGGSEADEAGSTASTPATEQSATADESAAASESPSDPAEESSPPVPDGVELTPQGSLLSLGEAATVAYQPEARQAGSGGSEETEESEESADVVDLSVDRLVRTTFKRSFQGWQLDKKTRRSTPYFVTASISNAGERRLRDRTVPLYLLDDKNTLIEASTFAGDFKPCPSTPLPKRFRPGAEKQVCLVYLAPRGRELAGVSFRPEQDFEAITWTGQVRTRGRG